MLQLALAILVTTAPSPQQNVAVLGSDMSINGAAVLLSPTQVLTAAHVLDSDRVGIVLCAGEAIPGRVTRIDRGDDLAVLSLVRPCQQTLTALAYSDPSVGTDVYALGCPERNCGTITKGVVARYDVAATEESEHPVLVSDAKIYFGNSGGGLYNPNNELVGIASQISCPSMGGIRVCYGFFIPVSTIHSFLER
jgi:S1-C subfamily serine protease